MPDDIAIDDRPLGARYRIDEPGGTWWEVGWDRPLGTYYAQQYSPVPYDPFTHDNLLASHGARPSELASVAALAARLPVPLPEGVADELERDAAVHPHTVDPSFLHVARALDRIEGPAVGRTTLPAEPVADALQRLRLDPYLSATDLSSFVSGLGIDPALARAVIDGDVVELNVEQISHVCEALRCSPYDLWGRELGREIIDVYGPERWPRYIEPLDDGRATGIADSFIRRRVEQQAAEVVHLADAGPSRLALEVTRYHQTALLAVDADGATERVTDTLQPADPSRDYHFAFQRVGGPETVVVGLSPAEFAAGCPAGADATPALVDMANRLDRVRPGTDMFRFTDPSTEAEQWIGRDTPFDSWQTWDDPRRYYPGDPADVLNEGVVELTPTLPFDSHSVDVEAELEGAGLDL